MNPDIDRILREQAERVGATGDMGFLGSMERRETVPAQRATYEHPRARASGWTNPAGAARHLSHLLSDEGAGELDTIMEHVESWTSPLDGVSRGIGGALSGRNPLDTKDNPTTAEVLIERGVPPWLAWATDIILVPDPTGARAATDLIPVLGMLASPQGVRALRNFFETAFKKTSALPRGTARRAYIAGEMLSQIDDGIADSIAGGAKNKDISELQALRQEIYGAVDWDTPAQGIGVSFDDVNPIDTSTVVQNLQGWGNADLGDGAAHQLERLLRRWNEDMTESLQRWSRGEHDWALDAALNPNSPRHREALDILGGAADAEPGAVFGTNQIMADLYEQFGNNPSVIRAAGLDPSAAGDIRAAGIDIAADSYWARSGATALDPATIDVINDPTAIQAVMDMMEIIADPDGKQLLEMVRVYGPRQVAEALGGRIAQADPNWDIGAAIMALTALAKDLKPR